MRLVSAGLIGAHAARRRSERRRLATRASPDLTRPVVGDEAGERALRVRSAIVDAPLLNALGVQPAQGRRFRRDDTIVTAAPLSGGSAIAQPVVLISYELWQSAFGGRPIVGERVEVDGRRLEVVGVMARGNDLMDSRPEIWLPLGFTDDERRGRNNHNLSSSVG